MISLLIKIGLFIALLAVTILSLFFSNKKIKPYFIVSAVICLILGVWNECNSYSENNTLNAKIGSILNANRAKEITDSVRYSNLMVSVKSKGFYLDSNYNLIKINNTFDNKENKGVQSFGQKGGQTAGTITNTYK